MASTSNEAIVKYQVRVGDRIGNIQVTSVNATLVAPGMYRVWHTTEDAGKLAIEYATRTEYVGAW